jgi:hypothetical protein
VLTRAACSLLLGVLACSTQVPEPTAETTERVSALAAPRPLASPGEEVSARVPLGWRFDLHAAPTRAPHYLVDSDSALASQAGVDVLAAGGNAIDAAVTVAFVLAAVYPEAGNLGGGGFAVLRSRDGIRAEQIHFLSRRQAVLLSSVCALALTCSSVG